MLLKFIGRRNSRNILRYFSLQTNTVRDVLNVFYLIIFVEEILLSIYQAVDLVET